MTEKNRRWSDGGEMCNHCISAPAKWSGLCEDCHRNGHEKSLYQIAVERFLDRLSKAKSETQDDIILMLHKLDPLSEPRRAEMAADITRKLFPELYPKADR